MISHISILVSLFILKKKCDRSCDLSAIFFSERSKKYTYYNAENVKKYKSNGTEIWITLRIQSIIFFIAYDIRVKKKNQESTLPISLLVVEHHF